MKPIIIAHRGASFLSKHDNTLESFQTAIDLGAKYAEFDIRRTKDNVLIAFHDDNIDGIILSELTYSDLCEITKKKDYIVPKLEEVLNLCKGKIKLDIELKELGYEKRIINIVKHYYDYEDFFMKSFVDKSVERIKSIDSNICAGLLIGSHTNTINHRFNEYFPIRRLKGCHADFVSPYYKIATPEFISRMHKHNIKVYSWTVNDALDMCKLLYRNIDGIITDRPDVALPICKAFCIQNDL